MTNGVSFSLVAGACCFIKFSNKVSSSQDATISLNINSTGAKSISLFFVTIYYNYVQTTHTYSPLTLRTAALPQACLIMYDGSMYTMGYSCQGYEDYSD